MASSIRFRYINQCRNFGCPNETEFPLDFCNECMNRQKLNCRHGRWRAACPDCRKENQ